MNPIITCLLNGAPDPQRGTTLAADWALLGDLIESVGRQRLVVISDCLTNPPEGVELHQVEPDPATNVYFLRWRHIAAWIVEHPDVSWCWCVDGTDVRLLRGPWEAMSAVALSIGSETQQVGCSWMRATSPDHLDWIDAHAAHTLLNPGLVGGRRDLVQRFAEGVADREGRDLTDMAAANVVAHELGFITGAAIHTTYKAWADNGTAAWQHK